MVRWAVRLHSDSGGGMRPIMVQCGTTYVTMVVAYIPTTTPATVGTTCGVSRLLKHIPVYGFYGYWRIKGNEDEMPLLLSFTRSNIFKITEDKTLMPNF